LKFFSKNLHFDIFLKGINQIEQFSRNTLWNANWIANADGSVNFKPKSI